MLFYSTRSRIIMVILFICVLSGLCASPKASAWTPPSRSSIDSLEALLEWYPQGGNCRLTNEIVISQPVTLSQTKGADIDGDSVNRIRIVSGGALIIDSSKTRFSGTGSFAVEDGGTLTLKSGGIWGAHDQDVILLSPGAVLNRTPGFYIEGIISNGPAPAEITGLSDETPAFTTFAGPPPETFSLPQTVAVAIDPPLPDGSTLDVPVDWDLSAKSLTLPGVYQVPGALDEEELAKLGVSNPLKLCPTLTLTLTTPGPITSMEGTLIDVTASNQVMVQLKLPPLPDTVTALYAEHSPDQVNWTRSTWYEPWTDREEDNFLQLFPIETEADNYLVDRFQVDYQPIYVRVEVLGSPYEGFTNVVTITLPGSDDETASNDRNDGSSGGNRGGGGQGESERLLPEDSSLNASDSVSVMDLLNRLRNFQPVELPIRFPLHNLFSSPESPNSPELSKFPVTADTEDDSWKPGSIPAAYEWQAKETASGKSVTPSRMVGSADFTENPTPAAVEASPSAAQAPAESVSEESASDQALPASGTSRPLPGRLPGLIAAGAATLLAAGGAACLSVLWRKHKIK